MKLFVRLIISPKLIFAKNDGVGGGPRGGSKIRVVKLPEYVKPKTYSLLINLTLS